jgi:hypothetical protein
LLNGKIVHAADLAAVGLRILPLTRTTIIISVTSLHVDIELHIASGELSVRAPFAIYGDKSVGGLCGKFYQC